MRLTIGILARINRFICDVGIVVACGLLVLMTSAVLLQVASREMRTPIGWTEEAALASMVWVAFLVGPWAFRNNMFTRIDVLIEAVSFRARSILNVLIHTFEALLLVGAIYYSWRFFVGGTSLLPALTRLARDIAAPFLAPEIVGAIAIQNRFIYVVLPLGFALLLLVAVEHLLRAILTALTGEEQRAGEELGGVASPPASPEIVQRRQEENDRMGT